VVSSAYSSGLTTTPTSTLQFLSPTVTVSYATSQKIIIMSTVSLGTTTAGGANGLDIYPCYKLSTATSPITIGGGMFGLQTVQNTRLNFSVSGVATGLVAGTYQVGLCGSATSANWTNNEYGYTTAIVTN